MKLHPRIHSPQEAFFKRKYFKQWRGFDDPVRTPHGQGALGAVVHVCGLQFGKSHCDSFIFPT